MPQGQELVPYRVDYYDERGWTEFESATSYRLRKVWAVEAGQSYIRVQTFGAFTKTFPPQMEQNTLDITSIVVKDTETGFPAVHYYHVVDVPEK